MVRRRIGCGLAAMSLLGWAPAAFADETPPIFIWYRSAEGCPGGEAFLQRLAARGVSARIAQVGDSVDFVVTLGATESGAEGVLERQDSTKTVAIRRLSGGSCVQVADGIALGLVLAGAPDRDTPGPSPEPPSQTPVPPPPASPPATIDTARAEPKRGSRARWALGVQAGVALGLTPEPWPGGGAFVELEPHLDEFLRDAAFRVWAFGASTSASGEHGFQTWLAAGRMEACPLRFGSTALSGSPCAAIDLGAVGSSTGGQQGRTDVGFWSAVQLAARLAVRVSELVALEAQMAGVVPLTRYEFVSELDTNTVYRAQAVGLSAGAGVNVRLP